MMKAPTPVQRGYLSCPSCGLANQRTMPHIDTSIKDEEFISVEFAREFGRVYYEGG